jgi:multidrug efflux pump subunit AcrB
MNSLIAWFAGNRVAANMLMVLLVALGYIAANNARKENTPNIEFNVITITAAYPGASPTEAEEAVCTRLEQAVRSVQGIDKLESYANEQACTASATLGHSANVQEIREQIKAKVDAISTFPSAVSRPIVKQITIAPVIAKLTIAGQANHRTLKTLAEKVRDDLTDLGLNQVELSDARKYEIAIEVSEAELQKYNLSYMEIVSAIQRNSVKASGGSVATSAGAIAVEAGGQAKSAYEFGELILRATPDGGHIKLSDIAEITDGFEQTEKRSYFNGKPSVTLGIKQTGDLSIIEISDRIHQYLENPRTVMPEGIEIELISDSSKLFNNSIQLLLENGAAGLLLVFFALLLFLRFELSFWVSAGIPISFMGGLVVLVATGNSINMISTFGLLLVLGIVVDDAIIVGENIFTHQTGNTKGSIAAIRGAQEISKPVVFAVITTAITFLPLLFMPGAEGELMRSLPIVVIATLFFSLVECLLILPNHLSHYKKVSQPKNNLLTRIQAQFSKGMDYVLQTYYRPLLNAVLKFRYTAVAVFIGIFFISLAVVGGGWVNVKLLSDIEGEGAFAKVSFARGTSIETTKSAVNRIEQAAMDLRSELREQYGADQIKHIRTLLADRGNHTGQVIMALTGSEERELSGDEISELWRKKVGHIQKTSQLSFSSSFNSPGSPIEIVLSSQNSTELKAAADDLTKHLSTYDATYGVRNSFQAGKREVKLQLKATAYDLGLDMQTLAGQVRQAFHGMDVQSIQRNQGEVKVFLRYPEDERSSLWHLENMLIRLVDGSHVPLLAVADVFYGSGPSRIVRENGRRIISVQANVDTAIASVASVKAGVNSEFLDSLEHNYPSVRWDTGGAQKAETKLKEYFIWGFILALLVMYMLMATLFESYFQPSIVLTAIPFGIVGALLGHLMLGFELNLWSAAGIIAVSGIVVNDNMVLIFFINENRAKGELLEDAIREAGIDRFRPIMLTSVTTFAGLAPLLLEKSFEAQFLIPMAISVAFGVMFATLVSLLLIPALYLIFDDFGRNIKVRKILTVKKDEPEVRYGDEGIVDDL